MAREALTEADLDALQVSAGGMDHVAIASRFEELAGDPQPADVASPAALLVDAGEHWGYAGEPARALECFRRAVAEGGHVAPDARCYLLHGLLVSGRTDEAERLAAEVKAERPLDPDVYLFVGEAYETQDNLAEATRWFTSGMFRAMRSHDVSERDALMLMRSRHRVRQAQGFPADDFDEVAMGGLEAPGP